MRLSGATCGALCSVGSQGPTTRRHHVEGGCGIGGVPEVEGRTCFFGEYCTKASSCSYSCMGVAFLSLDFSDLGRWLGGHMVPSWPTGRSVIGSPEAKLCNLHGDNKVNPQGQKVCRNDLR